MAVDDDCAAARELVATETLGNGFAARETSRPSPGRTASQRTNHRAGSRRGRPIYKVFIDNAPIVSTVEFLRWQRRGNREQPCEATGFTRRAIRHSQPVENVPQVVGHRPTLPSGVPIRSLRKSPGTSGTSCRSDRRAACGAWTPAALRVAIIFVKILPNMHGSRPAPFPVVIRDCGISAVGLVSIDQDLGAESDGHPQIKSYRRNGVAKAQWLNLRR